MEKEFEELQKFYPEASETEIHNMIQDLKTFCICCIEETLKAKQKQAVNNDEKIPKNSS